jgi:hypothetical protein
LLPEELVVNVELGVNIRGVENRDALRAIASIGLALRKNGTGAETNRGASDVFDELPPRADVSIFHRER